MRRHTNSQDVPTQSCERLHIQHSIQSLQYIYTESVSTHTACVRTIPEYRVTVFPNVVNDIFKNHQPFLSQRSGLNPCATISDVINSTSHTHTHKNQQLHITFTILKSWCRPFSFLWWDQVCDRMWTAPHVPSSPPVSNQTCVYLLCACVCLRVCFYTFVCVYSQTTGSLCSCL